MAHAAEPRLKQSTLHDSFRATAGRTERVGVELECALLDGAGHSLAYRDGEATSIVVMEHLHKAMHDSEPITDGRNLIGITLSGRPESPTERATFTLEAGGSLEYSSAPFDRVYDAVRTTQEAMRTAAAAANGVGVALVAHGMSPYTAMSDERTWIDKSRVGIMRRFFQGLGDDGSLADGVMGLTLSAQTSLDYLTPTDLQEKLRVAVLAAPIIAAMFVNSPIENGRDTGVASRRMQFWEKIDPARCKVPALALDPRIEADDIAAAATEAALDMSMIFRPNRSTPPAHLAAPKATFRQLMDSGFGDGTMPDLRDWNSHLCQFWPQVRLRKTIELRALDGPPWDAFPASVAIWVGLLYDADARAEAARTLAPITIDNGSARPAHTVADAIRDANIDVAIRGLGARIAGHPVADLARSLLATAQAGIERRVAYGLDDARILGYLAPMFDVFDEGTFAERTRARWPLDPATFIDLYRVPLPATVR